MDEPITFTFAPNPSDYTKTLRAFSFRQRSMITLMVIALLIVILVIISFIITGSNILMG